MDDQNAEGSGQQKSRHDPRTNKHNPSQLLGSANAKMKLRGTKAAAADRTQRPNAACEAKNG